MSKERFSVREWQERFRAGEFNEKDVGAQMNAGWYDWFCRDSALAGRLQRIAPVVMGITEPAILDNYSVCFKNNCPLNGPLYDDVRFEPLEGERDGRYFLVALDSPHEKPGHKWALTAERSGFDEAEFGCGNVREMCEYINDVAYELARVGEEFPKEEPPKQAARTPGKKARKRKEPTR